MGCAKAGSHEETNGSSHVFSLLLLLSFIYFHQWRFSFYVCIKGQPHKSAAVDLAKVRLKLIPKIYNILLTNPFIITLQKSTKPYCHIKTQGSHTNQQEGSKIKD